MNSIRKYAALAQTALLAMLLTGCSGSGSNAGVWIAVIVMVFIAVFSATSGIVYLVLQRVLPPEKPKRTTRRAQNYDYDDREPERYQPARSPRTNAAPQGAPAANGVWICPRDRSRNTGPYCAVCGGNRPVAPRPSANQAQRPEQSAPVRPQPNRAQNVEFDDQKPVRQPAPPAYTPPVVQPEEKPEYRGAFARPAGQEPEPLDFDFDADSGVDSELLEAIFRQAAEGEDEL